MIQPLAKRTRRLLRILAGCCALGAALVAVGPGSAASSEATCPITDVFFRVAGTPSIDQAMLRWQREVCLSSSIGIPLDFTQVADAEARMREANPHLSEDMARHLTLHGVIRLENGHYAWKFDNYVRVWGPNRYDVEAVRRLWSRVRCPVLLVRGDQSWARDPVKDGRASSFPDYRYVEIAGAGHWVHHDRLDEFLSHLNPFLDIPVRA